MKDYARKMFSVLLCVTTIVLVAQIVGCGEKPETAKDSADSKGEAKVAELSSDCDWPMFGRTPEGNRIAPEGCGPKTDNLGLIWKKVFYADIFSSPIVLNGKLFVASSNKIFACFDSKNGNKLWEFKTFSDFTGSPVVNGGKVFVKSLDELYCLNADSGAIIWRIFAAGESFTSLVYHEGKIFYTSWEDLYCVSAESGKDLWRLESQYTIFDECVIAEKKVFLVSRQSDYGNSIVYCLSLEDGKLIWQFEHANVHTSIAYYKNNVFFGAKYDFDDYLFCLSAENGAKVWSQKTSSVILSMPILNEDKAYFYCEDNKLYCLSIKDKKMIWEINATGNIQFSPTICSNKVYFYTDDEKLNSVSATDGKTLSYFSVIGGISSPIVICNGMIFFGSNYRYLYCIGDNGSADKKVEESDLNYIFTDCGWPMYNRSRNGNKSIPDDCGPKSGNLSQKWEYNALMEFSYTDSYEDRQLKIANEKFYLYSKNVSENGLSNDKLDCIDIKNCKVIESYENIPFYPEIITKDRFYGVYDSKVYCYSFEKKDILWESEKFWITHDLDNKLFLWNNLICYLSDSSLFFLSPETGATIYEKKGVSIGGPLTSYIILNDKIYIKVSTGSQESDDYWVYCYSLQTGDMLWTTELKYYSSSELIGFDEKIFISTANEIQCLDGNTGKNLWSSKIDNGCTPVLHKGSLYALSSDKMICIDASNGKIIKEFNVKGNDLSILNNMAFVTVKDISENDKVLCVSLETGEIIWEYNAKTNSINSIVYIADKKIFFVDNQTIHCFGDER